MQKLTQEGLNLIKSHEGLSLTAYICPAGYWTIGYGCRIRDNSRKFVDKSLTFAKLPIQKITEIEAEKMLKIRISEFETQIKKHFKNIDKLNDSQYSAFISLVFNTGIGAIGNSLRNLIENDPNNIVKIEQIWLKYNKSGGKVFNGLTKRREAEIQIYKS